MRPHPLWQVVSVECPPGPTSLSLSPGDGVILGVHRYSDAILTGHQTLRYAEARLEMIVLRALGTSEIETEVATLTPSQEIVFAAALYLVLERGRRVSRARLASMLWPRIPEKKRAHRLRQTIFQMKKLGVVVNADRDNLQLAQHEARTDVDEVLLSAPATVLEHHSLEFLPGYNPRLSEALCDWVDSKRAEAHATATGVLVHALEQSRLQADWPKVERIAAKCLSLDSYNETAILAQAEAAAMRGGKRRAVSILDRYIADIGVTAADLHLPATLLRRRVVERIPDSRPALLNADPPFVGREVEMEVLTKRFTQARNGKGSAALLLGEPGIGKSRLCAELARFAELQGAQVQRATCRRTDVDRPLSLFVDIVPQLREMPGALGCDPETFTWLKRLTEFEQPSGDASRQGDADMLFQHVRAALFDLFDSVAEERCLVVLIEDVQWLDDASAKILSRMVEWGAARRLFFLMNSRPTDNAFLDYAEKAHLDTMVLGPLKPVAATAFLKSVALRPGDAPQPEFVNWCLAVAEGNPFFLQALAHQWIETGQRYDAPPSIAKVLQERLSRLSGEALQVLQACAVLGEHSTVDRVERVLEYHPHQLLSAIEELSKGAMLGTHVDRNDSPNELLQPRHDFLSSAAIGRLAPVSLAFLHRRSADVLEAEIAQDKMPTTLLWACASHRQHAGDRERALTLSMSCAEHLLELGLAGEACTAFLRSTDYCITDTQRLQVLPRLAFAFELDAEWEKCKQALRTCAQLFVKQDPANNQHNEFELLLLDARHRSALDFTTLLDETIPCVESINASSAHRVGAAVIAMKLATDCGRSDYVSSIYQRVSPLLNDRDVSERNRLELQIIYRTDMGDGLVPVEELARFADVARSTQGELGYSRALITAATACRRSGRYREGLDFVSKAFDHAIQSKLHARHLDIKLKSISLHIGAGAFDKAREVLQGIDRSQLGTGNPIRRNEILSNETRLALEEGNLANAVAAFESIDSPSSNFSMSRRGYYLALEVRIRLAQGAHSTTMRPLVDELEKAHVQLRASGTQDFEAHALYLGLCRLGEIERGKTLMRQFVSARRPSPLAPPQDILDALELGAMASAPCEPDREMGELSRG